jgi:hypothetical protein
VYETLPGINLYRRPADATFLVGGLLAILAGYGAHLLFRNPHALRPKDLAPACAIVAAALTISIALALWLDRSPRLALPLGGGVAWFAAGALALWVVSGRIATHPIVAACVLAAITTVDIAYNNGPSSATGLPPATYDALQPATRNATIATLKNRVIRNETRRDRIELTGLGFHWPNAGLTHGLESTVGYNPVRLALYEEATGVGEHASLPEQRQFSPLFPSYRSTLADLLGLRFIATGVPVETFDRKLKPGDLQLVGRTRDGFIYENTGARDRVMFATEAKSADFSAMLKNGVWPPVDFARTVLLQEAPGESPPRRSGRARIVSYHNTEVLLEVDSPDGGWVVLNDLWHPWWFAQSDGAPVEILRANVLFRAIAVPPGPHQVRFLFRPIAGALSELKK